MSASRYTSSRKLPPGTMEQRPRGIFESRSNIQGSYYAPPQSPPQRRGSVGKKYTASGSLYEQSLMSLGIGGSVGSVLGLADRDIAIDIGAKLDKIASENAQNQDEADAFFAELMTLIQTYTDSYTSSVGKRKYQGMTYEQFRENLLNLRTRVYAYENSWQKTLKTARKRVQKTVAPIQNWWRGGPSVELESLDSDTEFDFGCKKCPRTRAYGRK